MPLVTAKKTGLVDQVITQIRGLVASGEWPVGSKIPPESELVSALGVGRNTVREAVRALSHAGLLEVRQGDGTFVRARNELSGAVRRLCGTELRQVLEVRRALEVEAARLASLARTEEDLRELVTLMQAREAAIDRGDGEAVISEDAAFHRRLVAASHNPVLTELYEAISESVLSSVATTFTLAQLVDERMSHTGLLAAIRDKDTERAVAEATCFLNELLDQLEPRSGTSDRGDE